MRIEVNNVYTVQVIRIGDNGIWVNLIDSSTRFIHISKMSEKYVVNPYQVVSLYDILEAKCIQSKERVELSLIHLKLPIRDICEIGCKQGETQFDNSSLGNIKDYYKTDENSVCTRLGDIINKSCDITKRS